MPLNQPACRPGLVSLLWCFMPESRGLKYFSFVLELPRILAITLILLHPNPVAYPVSHPHMVPCARHAETQAGHNLQQHHAALLPESAVGGHVRHLPHIVVQVYGACSSSNAGTLLYVTQFMAGGDLRQALSADNDGLFRYCKLPVRLERAHDPDALAVMPRAGNTTTDAALASRS